VAKQQSTAFWQGKKVLVTGATGFVGAWLIKRLLANGCYVVALVRDFDPQSEFIRSGDYKQTSIVSGDINDYFTIQRAIVEHDIGVVFHLAAQALVHVGHNAPLLTFESNVRGTYNLLEACRMHQDTVKSILVASSDKDYGDSAQLPYLEEMPLAGKNPYDASKSCTDIIAQSYAQTYDLPLVITRFGNIYGGGDLNWSRIVPGTIRSILNNERPVLRSDGSFVRDYVYVEDVIDGYMLLSKMAPDLLGEAFNLSCEAPATVLEIVQEIQSLLSRTDLDPVILSKAEGEIHSQHLDSSKVKKLTGWEPKHSLREGLKQTIDWYRQYLSQTTGMTYHDPILQKVSPAT
jgi:CDP-glucose 4,6-dehydratase